MAGAEQALSWQCALDVRFEGRASIVNAFIRVIALTPLARWGVTLKPSLNSPRFLLCRLIPCQFVTQLANMEDIDIGHHDYRVVFRENAK